MARKIDSAVDHGIGMFLFDWYWYNSPAMTGVPDLQVCVYMAMKVLSRPTRNGPGECVVHIAASVCMHRHTSLCNNHRSDNSSLIYYNIYDNVCIDIFTGQRRGAVPGWSSEQGVPEGTEPQQNEVCHYGESL